MSGSKEQVWYLAYGTNLFRERFKCYITGGQFRLGGKPAVGCSEKTLPEADVIYRVPHRLYFAKTSAGWNGSGVAFLDPEPSDHETLCRLWKVSRTQLDDIQDQEGRSWYGYRLHLGYVNGMAVETITNAERLPSTQPLAPYLRTIALGLVESHHLTSSQIYNYLLTSLNGNSTALDEALKDLA